MRRIAVLIAALLLASCAARRPYVPSRTAEKEVTHRVLPGETWETIAGDYYGKPDRADALAAHNGTEPNVPPEPGSGVRIPLARGDLRRLRHRLSAAEAYNEGHDLAAAGNFAEAVERFRRALEIDPDFVDAAFNLAVTYQKLGLHRNAITVLTDLVTRAEADPAYYHALGHSMFHVGDIKGARTAFSRALEIDSNHRKSIFSLAVTAAKLGDTAGARALFDRYLSIDPEGEWADEARRRLRELPGR